jgi:hypothetical protein
MRSTLLVLAVLIAVLAAPAPAPALAAPVTFMTGFTDSTYEEPASTNVSIQRTVAAGAEFVLLRVNWAEIAPSPPPAGTDPSDPANPAFHWGGLDGAVRAAAANGLAVVLDIAGGGAPGWADGPGRPASVPPGTWRPNAGAFAAFAEAVARRYSGSFDPPGGVLPRVRYYQGWGEPNLPDHLNPQWVRKGGRWIPESAIIYRTLLNAFYSAIKSVNRSNVVVTAGTAPFGDTPGGSRVPPALFWRELLCVNGRHLRPQRCPDPAHFDILAHDPYAIGGPFDPAFDPDDVSIPDFDKLTAPLRVAERTGRALPRGRKQVWVTEFGWISRPPNPGGVPVIKLAYWTEEAFYELWHEGVDAAAWYLLVDQPTKPGNYESGVYYLDGQAKPGLEAFRFPFVVEPQRHHRSLVWGIAPTGGTVLVQRARGPRWQTMWRFHVRAHAIFKRTVKLRGQPRLRAVIGPETSLTWPQP